MDRQGGGGGGGEGALHTFSFISVWFTYALLCGEYLLHAPCSVIWGVSLTRPVLCDVGSFSYTPRAL